MKIKMMKDGTYSARVMTGRTPEGKRIYVKLVADSPIELWKQHYLLKSSQNIKDDTAMPGGIVRPFSK